MLSPFIPATKYGSYSGFDTCRTRRRRGYSSSFLGYSRSAYWITVSIGNTICGVYCSHLRITDSGVGKPWWTGRETSSVDCSDGNLSLEGGISSSGDSRVCKPRLACVRCKYDNPFVALLGKATDGSSCRIGVLISEDLFPNRVVVDWVEQSLSSGNPI
jgi:hypothetical protein